MIFVIIINSKLQTLSKHKFSLIIIFENCVILGLNSSKKHLFLGTAEALGFLMLKVLINKKYVQYSHW